MLSVISELMPKAVLHQFMCICSNKNQFVETNLHQDTGHGKSQFVIAGSKHGF